MKLNLIEEINSPMTTRRSKKKRLLFRTGQYDGEQLTQEFRLPRRRSALNLRIPSSIQEADSNSEGFDEKDESDASFENEKRERLRKANVLPWYTNILIQFRIVSGKSSARDKIMAFIQGWSLWRRALLPHDEAEGERIYLMQIEEWMKDVRKGFKVGKFVVEVEKARNSYTTVRDRITRWLEVAMHFVAFGYHLTDNRLFMGKIYYRARKIVSDDLMIRHGPKPVQGQVEFVSSLKRSKNLFSLIRCILAIICESRHVLQLTGDLNKIALCRCRIFQKRSTSTT